MLSIEKNLWFEPSGLWRNVTSILETFYILTFFMNLIVLCARLFNTSIKWLPRNYDTITHPKLTFIFTNYVIWQHVFLVTFFSDHKYSFLLYELLCTSSAAIVTIVLFDVFDILMNSKHYWWFLGLSSSFKEWYLLHCGVYWSDIWFFHWHFSSGVIYKMTLVKKQSGLSYPSF